MADPAIILLIALIGVIITLGFYYILSVSWPRLYFGPSDGLEMFVSSKFALFATFRIAPISLISGTVFAYSAALTTIPQATTPIAFFALYSMFLLSARIAHRVRHGRRLNLPDALWILASILLAGTGVLIGYFLAPALTPVLPSLGTLRDAIITAAAIAAALGAGRRFNLDGDHSARAIKNTATRHCAVTGAIERSSRQHGIDRWVISAIYIAEQLQRPRWLQGIERVLCSLGAPVSTGIFQTRSAPHGATTGEIIRYLEASPAATFAAQFGGLDEPRAHTVATMTYTIHNNSKPFVELCEAVRNELIEQEFSASYALPWVHIYGLQFGKLSTDRANLYSFTFSIHSRVDNRSIVKFKLAPSGEIDESAERALLPGETLQLSINRDQIGEIWTMRINGDKATDETNRQFVPLDSLPFAARWDG